MTRSSLLLLPLLAGLVACSNGAPDTPAKVVKSETAALCFNGANIYTANDDEPRVAAVAAVDGRITHAGDDTGDWCPDGARRVELGERALYPGLTDAHAHLIGIGEREMELDLSDTGSIRDIQDRVREVAARTPAGETIYGRGWIETFYPEARFPTRDDLDSVTTDHPVILQRADGHAAVVNSLALRNARIKTDTEDPFGGAINRDADGRANGMLIDNAQDLVADQIPSMDASDKARAYKLASDLYASRGWTNIHSMSVAPENVPMINRLANDGTINIRVYNSIGISERGRERVRDMQGGMSAESPLVVTNAVKLYADGALGSRGAALLSPYEDDPENSGLMTLDEGTALSVFTAALRNGVQVNTHAIGDMGNKRVLDWYEQAFAAVPASERMVAEPRWRIEHSQILDVADIPRFKALGVIPSMQPSHAIGDLHFAVDRLGPDRLKGGYAWRALIDSGSRIAGGSDAPVEVGDPRIELHAAILRTDLRGYSNENWGMDQRVTPQEALKMFTLWPAYAAFQEDELGSIEVGKRADFSVFSEDMLAEGADPMDAQAVMTVVDGRVVFER